MIDTAPLRAALVLRDAARDAIYSASPDASPASYPTWTAEDTAVALELSRLSELVCRQLCAGLRAVMFGDTVVIQYAFVHVQDDICQGMGATQLDAILTKCTAESLILGDLWT